MSNKDKAKYAVVAYRHQFRVVEVASGLILRTLGDRAEAFDFLAQIEPKKDKK